MQGRELAVGGVQHRFFGGRQSILRGQSIQPVELSMFTNRARSDGDWSTTIQPKAKTNIVPTGIGKVGFSIYAGGSFDALTGENRQRLRGDPGDVPARETMRINVNGGWLWDRSVDRHYLLYGIGFDWKFTETLQWTIEAFGQQADRIRQAWSSRGFRPACATGQARFFRST